MDKVQFRKFYYLYQLLYKSDSLYKLTDKNEIIRKTDYLLLTDKISRNIYYIAYPERLSSLDFSENGTEDIFPYFLEEYKIKIINKFSIIIPLGYGLITRNSHHSILLIIENDFVYIIDSERGTRDYEIIMVHIKNKIDQTLNIDSKCLFINAGIQYRNFHCVKYTFKLLYNYLKIGEKFSISQKALCPGYTKDKFKLDRDLKTNTNQTREIFNNIQISHLTKEDVLEFIKAVNV